MSFAVETFAYALLGGVFFGLYPSQIKTPAVLRARPSPVVFQMYKTAVVFVSGFVFLLPRALRGAELPAGQAAFVFSWWGFVAAFFWIPAGLTTIASVPLVGMGLVVAVSSASNAILSFTIATAVGINRMQPHSCGPANCTFYLAPVWLATTVLGIMVMVFPGKFMALARRHCAQKQKCEAYYDPVANEVELGQPIDAGESPSRDGSSDPGSDGDGDGDGDGASIATLAPHPDKEGKRTKGKRLRYPSMDMAPMIISTEASATGVVSNGREGIHGSDRSGIRGSAIYRYILGTVLAIGAGVLSVGQFLAITLGRYYEEFKANCSATAGSPFIARGAADTTSSSNVTALDLECPWYVDEQFDKAGSWYASFGIGAALVTASYLCLFVAWRVRHGAPNACPDMHWDILKSAGLKAGVLWTLGNVFTTLAVARGGNAIAMPQVLSFTLITSGGYGIMVYGEGENRAERMAWVCGALISLVSIILLGVEKAA
jgi:hypothetical protein